MAIKRATNWIEQEFEDAQFNDERLKARVIKLVDPLSEAPESPINQACRDWAETKAAYRFFGNEKIDTSEILSSHINKTVGRARSHQKILAIQDTAYFNYSKHIKTKGLGILSRKKGTNVKDILGKGLIMHTAFAITTDGLPLGILDQKIFSRRRHSKKMKTRKKRTHNVGIPIKDKESFKWIEALIHSNYHMEGAETKMITVCDREADIYDLYALALKLKSSVLIRARGDRIINKTVRYSEKPRIWLWKHIENQPIKGKIVVEIPSRGGKFGSIARSAMLELRYDSFIMSPHRSRPDYRILSQFKLSAVYVIERHPPKGEEPLEWMLLTDLPVSNFDEAAEKVSWYSYRFRIETLHRILKSGFIVEQCRLGTAKSLIRYLTVMSIVSWRIFWITIMGRLGSDLPCTQFLTDAEWKVLYSKFYQSDQFPKKPMGGREAIHLISRLGGFLDRKLDGEPGVISIWRGWRRLCDLSDGWSMAAAASAPHSCELMGNG